MFEEELEGKDYWWRERQRFEEEVKGKERVEGKVKVRRRVYRKTEDEWEGEGMNGNDKVWMG